MTRAAFTRGRSPAVAAVAAVALALVSAPAAGNDADMLSNLVARVQRLVAQELGEVATAVAVQPDGKVVYAGMAPHEGHDTVAIGRNLADGTRDPAFNDGHVTLLLRGYRGTANAISVQRDGKILIGGQVFHKGHVLSFFAARLQRDGTPDASFGKDGVVVTKIADAAIAMGIGRLPDGDIMLGGAAFKGARTVFAVHRLTTSGENARYGTNGTVTVPVGSKAGANGFAIQPDGKPVLVGESTVGVGRALTAVRLTDAGAPDPSFGKDGVARVAIGSESAGNAIALQSDGKIVLVGGSSLAGSHLATVRLDAGGHLDRSFAGDGISVMAGTGRAVNAVALQRDGKIVLGGGASAAGADLGVLRLHPDGTHDVSLGISGRVKNESVLIAVNGVAVQPDGGIVLAGTQAEPSGKLSFALVRVDASGRMAPWSERSGWTLDPELPRVTVSRRALKPLRNVVSLVLRNDNDFALTGSARLTRADGRPRLVGHKRFSAAASGHTVVRVRVTKTVRRLLRAGEQVKTLVDVKLRATYGPAVHRRVEVTLKPR